MTDIGQELSQDKSWIISELNPERDLLRELAASHDGRIMDIRNRLNMTTNQFNPYRMRLIRKGIVNGDTHGILSFTLPVFREFVIDRSINEEQQKVTAHKVL